ncbi:MAG TPA: pitrilysin family protein [Bacteroidales bacterium]|nr:pitrilysin family protein [Bacteroidales bacterium]HPS17073.1 pitrilysin family protein [Bacteroidales bacterium]
MYQNYTLPNGIQLVHKQTPSLVSHCAVIINTGSRDENENEQGIAHFIEHVIFKGTSNRNMFQVLSRMENVGGEINAFTSKEDTCVYTSFLNKYYERALELMSDIVFNSTFPEKEIEKEKDVVLDEINSYKDNPAEEIIDEFEKQLFGNHSIGRYVLGTPKSIRSISRSKLQRFIKRCYNTNQVVICSVGNISFEELKTLALKHYGEKANNTRKWERKHFTGNKTFEKIISKPIHQTHCVIGNHAYSSKHKMKNPLILLSNILGGQGMNSRLSMNIREKFGFCYNIDSSYNPYSDTGSFEIYMGTEDQYMEKVILLVHKELQKLRENKIGSLQLKYAKQQLIGQLAISYDHNLNEMLSMGKSFSVYHKVDTLEEISRKIDDITANQLMDVANDIFSTRKLSMLIFKSAL